MRFHILCFFVFFVLNLLTAQTWQQRDNFPGQARDDGIAVSFDAKSFYGFGSNNWFAYERDWWLFNHQSQEWEAKASFPGAAMQYASAIPFGNAVYLFGGFQQGAVVSDTIYRYNVAADQWEIIGNLPMGARFAAMTTKHRNRILAGMGNDGQRCHTDIWWYTPQTNDWEFLTNFPGSGRQQMKAFVAGEYLVVGSGRCGGNCFFDWWQFHLEKQIWEPYQEVEATFCSYQNTFEDAEWYIMGGGMTYLDSFSADGFSTTWWGWHKPTQEWVSLPNFTGTPKRGGGVFRFGSTIQLVSGLNSNGSRDDEVWQLDLPKRPAPNKAPIIFLSREATSLNIHLNNPQPFSLQCFNTIGAEVYSVKQDIVQAESVIDLPILSNGLYVIKLQINGEQYTKKLIFARD